MTELMNLREGARELRISIYTLRSWIYQKKLTHVRLGRRVLLRREDIESLISRGLVKSEN